MAPFPIPTAHEPDENTATVISARLAIRFGLPRAFLYIDSHHALVPSGSLTRTFTGRCVGRPSDTTKWVTTVWFKVGHNRPV